jgi:two-component system, response regulator PdtaR
LIPAVEIALRQAENTQVYREQVENMNKQLMERKLVEKAKGILMDKYNIPEDAAYRKMRKISMNKQVTLENVAKHIILKYNA